MKVKQEGQELRFVQMMFLFLMFAAFTGIVSATNIAVQNADFDDAGDPWNVATGWEEEYYNVYYKVNGGNGYNTNTIKDRAATFHSTGQASISQLLNVYCNDYDVYCITFDVGYRNDNFVDGDAKLQVALKNEDQDGDDAASIGSENIVIGKPNLDSSCHPNVGTVMQRTVVLKLNRMDQPADKKVRIWFINKSSATIPENKCIVIDNISIKGYKTIADWPINGETAVIEDATGAHDLIPLAAPFHYGSGGNSRGLYTRESYSYYGGSTQNSTDFNLNNFTVSAWVKMPSWALNLGDTRGIICYRNLGDKRSGFFLYCNASDVWRLQLGSSAGSTPLGKTSVVPDEWTNLVFRVAKTDDYGSNEILVTAKLHVNGNYDDVAENAQYKPAVPNSRFCIGYSSPTNGDYFTGYIDNVQYFNYYMQNIEIADMFIEQKKKEFTPDIGEMFKVMTYNIASLAKNPSSLAGAIEVIGGENPDILCLQEATQANVDNLSAGLGYSYKTWVRCNTQYNYGNAILSKTPLYVINDYKLTSAPLDLNQTRKMTVVHTIIKGKAYAIANTHFVASCEEGDNECDEEARQILRIEQAKDVINILAWCKTPLILTGDLNNTNNGRAVDLVKQMFIDSFDLPEMPELECVDHVMVSRNTFHDSAVLTQQIEADETISDHRPVVTTFMVGSE